MSCLSKTLIEDVSLTIGEQLQYIGFAPVNVGIDTNVIIPGSYYKKVCGITINIKLQYVQVGKKYGHRISLDWCDVVNRHLVETIYDQPTLNRINEVVGKLSDGALNIYIEKDKELWEY